MIKYFYLTFLVFFSCQMGEIPIDPHDSESMIVDQITISLTIEIKFFIIWITVKKFLKI